MHEWMLGYASNAWKKRFFRDLTTDGTFQIFDKYEYSAFCIRLAVDAELKHGIHSTRILSLNSESTCMG